MDYRYSNDHIAILRGMTSRLLEYNDEANDSALLDESINTMKSLEQPQSISSKGMGQGYPAIFDVRMPLVSIAGLKRG